MSRTTLQVPLDSTLRDKAEKVAIEAGFSSLQEVVRVFLTKLSKQKVDIRFYDEAVVSEKTAKRYRRQMGEIREGKNLEKAETYDELLAVLDEG